MTLRTCGRRVTGVDGGTKEDWVAGWAGYKRALIIQWELRRHTVPFLLCLLWRIWRRFGRPRDRWRSFGWGLTFSGKLHSEPLSKKNGLKNKTKPIFKPLLNYFLVFTNFRSANV